MAHVREYLLIGDTMSKDISGTGTDSNVVGRHVYGYDASLSHIPEYRPIIRHILVRDLTPGTHGNAVDLGPADFTIRRLTSQIDWQVTLLTTPIETIAPPAATRFDKQGPLLPA